jgi:hypothetical protein
MTDTKAAPLSAPKAPAVTITIDRFIASIHQTLSSTASEVSGVISSMNTRIIELEAELKALKEKILSEAVEKASTDKVC